MDGRDRTALARAPLGRRADRARPRARRYAGFAFSLTTPLRTIDVRAQTQARLDTWTDAILKVQSAQSFTKGDSFKLTRRRKLFKKSPRARLVRAARSAAVGRVARSASLPRACAPTHGAALCARQGESAINFRNSWSHCEEDTRGNGDAQFEPEISAMLKDPQLKAMLEKVADERNCAAELSMLMQVSGAARRGVRAGAARRAIRRGRVLRRRR